MATEIRRVTFDEFAADLAGFFERVSKGKETIEVERETGEVVLVEPAPVSNTNAGGKSKE